MDMTKIKIKWNGINQYLKIALNHTRTSPPLLSIFQSRLCFAVLVNRHLVAKIIRWLHVIVARNLALGILRSEDEELKVLEWKAELLVDVVVVLAGLETGTTCAVEAFARVDAGSGRVAVVFT
ncbi:hypothetical protein AJ78_08957 [Emergomyces pasteurianus Ep9510]|uniref:Uncharacterized protein n=1 Tax=Emergomyces pasteurianus Ep9510 TaxID=1447872 RepID=A0A1J9NYN9_9EURO|nr:hypothetical protein AJ78_08957 [Emergomyces pasteurianus Ep9510]